MTDDELRRDRERVVHKIPVPGAPAGPFDREAVVADRPFGIAADVTSAILKILGAADLSRGVAVRQPGRHPLAVIAFDAVEHLYVSVRVPLAREDELRRFMVARYEEYAPGREVRADPSNRWDGRFDARDLAGPHPWEIHDLRGAARDFLCVETFEYFRDTASPEDVRAAASLVLGSLAAIEPNGTTLALLQGVAGTLPRRDEPLSIAVHAWIREIHTGPYGEDTQGLVREGHRLLAVLKSLPSEPKAGKVDPPRQPKPPSKVDERAWALCALLGKNQSEAAQIMSKETNSSWSQSKVSRACTRVGTYRAGGGRIEGLPDAPLEPGRRRLRSMDPRQVEGGSSKIEERPREESEPDDAEPMQS